MNNMTKTKKPISKHLQDMIRFMPTDGWFTIDSRFGGHVPRTEWVCDNLVEHGILETKVEWEVDPEKGTKDRTDFRTVRFYKLIK